MELDCALEQLCGNFKPQDEILPVKNFTIDALLLISQQRRFCTTEMGLLGAVPFECKAGDKLFVLRGGAVLLILRAVESDLAADDSDQRYQLFGGSYKREVMYREGLSFDEVQESDINLV